MAATLSKRLMQDIAELQTKPYPRVKIHVDDKDVRTICLILRPHGWKPLHMTVMVPPEYPLSPPTIIMNSYIYHPNVYCGYICASILNTTEDYTPAYTLKGIAIQLLSFFGSDSIEQDYGDKVSLEHYRQATRGIDVPEYLYDAYGYIPTQCSYAFEDICKRCKFNRNPTPPPTKMAVVGMTGESSNSPRPRRRRPNRNPKQQPQTTEIDPQHFFIGELPNELLLQLFEHLDFEELTRFASAWDRISQLIIRYDVIRVRELQCFVLKENFMKQRLGVGVAVGGNGRQGTIESEFDILSHTAFHQHEIRLSIHNIPFQHWLPLPISEGHWRKVAENVEKSLAHIANKAHISSTTLVIYAFMNDVIVRLNSDLERQTTLHDPQARSTLRHASEKAIESYFHLFHLLLCIATSKPSVVAEANRMIDSFMLGRRSKTDIPNLGYLLIALLISDTDPTEKLMKEIVTEAITRNVVWLLDRKGAGFAELGYLESDPICQYRLKKTFEGSRTSYRLLMFSELFRRTARPSATKSATPQPPSSPSPLLEAAVEKPRINSYRAAAAATPSPPPSPPCRQSNKPSLAQVRDQLFRQHGGPGHGTAAHLAGEVRRLQKIDDFPNFMQEMGVTIPSASKFTSVLRDTVRESAKKGYSKSVVEGPMASVLAAMRIERDKSTTKQAIEEEMKSRYMTVTSLNFAMKRWNDGRIGFFPDRPGYEQNWSERGGRGGRGRGGR